MHKGAFARRGLGMMRPFMVVVALLAVGSLYAGQGARGQETQSGSAAVEPQASGPWRRLSHAI